MNRYLYAMDSIEKQPPFTLNVYKDVGIRVYEPYQSFSSATRLLTLLESIAEAPHRQVTKHAG